MSHVMDQQLPVRLSGDDLPLFSWEDFRPSTFLSTQSRPLLQEPATSNITSLLSARSYPLPEFYNSRTAQSEEQLTISDDVLSEPRPYPNRTNTNQSTLSKTTTPGPQKRRRRELKKAAPLAKKYGAPQGIVDNNEDPEEHRRTQIRLAQRAYRSRQQATMKGLENRITFLETTLDNMSSAFLSFSEQLVQSGVLEPHSSLTANLRDTMKTFLSLASEASPNDEIQVPNEPTKTTDSSLSSLPSPIKHPSPKISDHSPLDHTGLYQHRSDVLPYTLNSPGMSIVGVSEFIERLHLTALYQGYLVLCNQSIGLYQLQRPFGLIFSMMNRDRLASYFKAELYAQVSQKPLKGWEEVPFFSLGGAGTHYSGPSTQTRSAGTPFSRYKKWGTVEDPLSLVTADIQEQLEGDWFDLQDLEGFLRDRNVLLLLSADEPTVGSSMQTKINIARLIPALISRGICLGRTPGFQRGDVEKALHFSTIA